MVVFHLKNKGPLLQLVDRNDSESFVCRFESDRGHKTFLFKISSSAFLREATPNLDKIFCRRSCIKNFIYQLQLFSSLPKLQIKICQ